jgi:SAM-dependent methyltransferase
MRLASSDRECPARRCRADRDQAVTDHPAGRRPLFDGYGSRYRSLVAQVIQLSGEGPEYFAAYKVAQVLELFRSAAPPAHIVDVGCGVGLLTERLARALPSTRITGVDVSATSVDEAAARCADLPNVTFRPYAGDALPPEAAHADLVILANVLHHVEPRDRPALLESVILPALRQGGRLAVFEHNPYNPLTRRAVRACVFDRDARLLTLRAARQLLARPPLRIVRAAYVVFFPRPLRALRPLEARIGWLPLGAQYVLVAERVTP